MPHIPQNQVLELSYNATKSHNSPDDLELFVTITDPTNQKTTVPGYWAGNNTWRIRLSSAIIGIHSYLTSFSDPTDIGLHEQAGSFTVVPYTGTNPLYQHGKLRVAVNHRYLEHTDGTPFFWLGDTWWMGFTHRLHWPEEFDLLTRDRLQKQFTLIQIVAGLYPDMPPFDERGANEAGYPWQDNKFDHLNPAYFDMVDRRVQYLVDAGLVPCIVGFWGYFMAMMSVPALKKHWRYLIARYGAFPVVWCIAGEAMMNYYLNGINKIDKKQKLATWSDVTGYVRAIDGWHNPITIHPTQYGHKQLSRPQLLDVNMLQTGHANSESQIRVILNTIKMIGIARNQGLPIVVGEVCYEGILEANRQEIQRCLFWAIMLSGGAGHTYGANGIWQLNRRDQSYGASPHGVSWGETAWEDAYQLPGSTHVGLNKKVLTRYPWWRLEPHPEWVKNALTFTAGIPGQLRIFYRFLGGRFLIRKLEKGTRYNAFWIDPKNGKQYLIGPIQADKKGNWTTPNPLIMQDWILILERI